MKTFDRLAGGVDSCRVAESICKVDWSTNNSLYILKFRFHCFLLLFVPSKPAHVVIIISYITPVLVFHAPSAFDWIEPDRADGVSQAL